MADLSTMQGLLPPSSNVTGMRRSEARRITSLPTETEPVKKILSKGISNRAEFSALPPRTVVASSGGKASFTISARRALVAGEYAEGFKITVLPAAIASTSGSSESMKG